MMFMKLLSLTCVLSLILLGNSVFAQDQKATAVAVSSSAAVTAAVIEPNAIRLSSPGEISNIRVEVYTANGELVFDSGLRQGNVLDWKLSESTQAIGDGAYLFVVTTRDPQGKFRQRLGNIVVDAGHATLKAQAGEAVNGPQKQALSTRLQSQKITLADDVDAVTVLRPGKERSIVVSAHDRNGSTTTRFKLGTGEKAIGVQDLAGVNLAAIVRRTAAIAAVDAKLASSSCRSRGTRITH
jgi:hypothetical protein